MRNATRKSGRDWSRTRTNGVYCVFSFQTLFTCNRGACEIQCVGASQFHAAGCFLGQAELSIVGSVQIAGWLIVSFILLRGSLLTVSAWRRLSGEKRQQQLALELLRQNIAIAAVRKKEKEQSRNVWDGSRKFVVARKVEEGQDIASVYLAPFDRQPLPAFKPGQFLTFQFKIPGQSKPVVRCYSLSNSFHPEHYRVTIKKAPPPRDKPGTPSGLASTFVHDVLKAGDILDVQAPRGEFVLDLNRSTAVVLIAGGIGLTPMLCMANALAERGSQRETWLFYGVRNGREHVMKDELRKLSEATDRFRLRVCYSSPGPEDVEGRDYHHGQHVSLDVLKSELPSNNYEYYICGPSAMMTSMTTALKEWGVPEDRIFSEAFGPASVPKPGTTAAPSAAAAAATPGFKIVFSRSGKTLAWNPQAGSLLDLACNEGVSIPAGCRAGSCGTCETALKSGSVKYLSEPGWKAQAGTCLVCVAAPGSDVELDA